MFEQIFVGVAIILIAAIVMAAAKRVRDYLEKWKQRRNPVKWEWS
jgi:hypothetical protein